MLHDSKAGTLKSIRSAAAVADMRSSDEEIAAADPFKAGNVPPAFLVFVGDTRELSALCHEMNEIQHTRI